MMKKVCIIGLGYIGLPTAILAARAGLKVTGVDIDAQRVKELNECSFSQGEAEVLENLRQVCGAQNFYATTEYEPADYFVVAVPTPITKDKKADLSHVSTVASNIADVIKKGDTVILESTVPVGATQSFAQVIEVESGLKAGHDFYVAHCPERVLPGNILQELKVNDRVIGGIDPCSVQKAAEFYKYFVSGDLYLTDAATAEMVKLIENSSRDVNIAFAQQVAEMAAQEGLDPFEVIELANKHPRVSLLKPSCGTGGHCIAVDPWFLIQSFPENTELLKTARKVNENRSVQVLASIKNAIADWKKKHQKECTVLLLGLAYKPDVDDFRESRALAIAHQLIQDDTVSFVIAEPHFIKEKIDKTVQEKMVPLSAGIEAADIVIALVGHTAFKIIDKSILKEKTVLDFCGLFFEPQKESVEQEQFFWPASTSGHAQRVVHMGGAKAKSSIKEEQR
jgi:UDP-N-acetyl-D-mannosaminuronic acid dehydrogenase